MHNHTLLKVIINPLKPSSLQSTLSMYCEQNYKACRVGYIHSFASRIRTCTPTCRNLSPGVEKFDQKSRNTTFHFHSLQKAHFKGRDQDQWNNFCSLKFRKGARGLGSCCFVVLPTGTVVNCRANLAPELEEAPGGQTQESNPGI